MTVPLQIVAIAFLVVAIACLWDITKIAVTSVRIFRLTEAIITGIASSYYWEALSRGPDALPSPNLRFVWLALCVIMIAEIISRQNWGSRK